MSTRAQVVMEYEDGNRIYLYKHCDGYALPWAVKQAISREERWTDEAYFTRIIFSEMMLLDAYSVCSNSDLDKALRSTVCDSTGLGIGPYPAGDADVSIYINTSNQTIRVEGGSYSCATMSYRDFIDLPMNAPSWIAEPAV